MLIADLRRIVIRNRAAIRAIVPVQHPILTGPGPREQRAVAVIVGTALAIRVARENGDIRLPFLGHFGFCPRQLIGLSRLQEKLNSSVRVVVLLHEMVALLLGNFNLFVDQQLERISTAHCRRKDIPPIGAPLGMDCLSDFGVRMLSALLAGCAESQTACRFDHLKRTDGMLRRYGSAPAAVQFFFAQSDPNRSYGALPASVLRYGHRFHKLQTAMRAFIPGGCGISVLDATHRGKVTGNRIAPITAGASPDFDRPDMALAYALCIAQHEQIIHTVAGSLLPIQNDLIAHTANLTHPISF